MFKKINRSWARRWERFYSKNKWHLLLDMFSAALIIALVALVISLVVYRPKPIITSQTPPVSEIDLNNPPLEISFASASSSLKINDKAILKINLKNKGNVRVNQIKVNLLTSGQDFSIRQIKALAPDSSGEIKIDRQNLTWPSLDAGESREEQVEVEFSRKNESAKIIGWQAQSEYALGGQTIKENFVLPELKLLSELSIESSAYYTSPQGDQLGAGPLPPVVGLPTSYWLFWQLKSDGDFKNFALSARLPKNVELGSGRSLLAGELNYNSATRQLIWKIKEIKGLANGSYRVGFEVKLTPVKEQLGQILPLFVASSYRAEDALTGQTVSGELNSLTTNLDFDPFNKGQGKVEE